MKTETKFGPTEIAGAYANCFELPKEDYYPLRQTIMNTINKNKLGERDKNGQYPQFNKLTAADIAVIHFARDHKGNACEIGLKSVNDRPPNLSIFNLEMIHISEEYNWEGWHLDIANFGIVPEGSAEKRLVLGTSIQPRHTNDPPQKVDFLMMYVQLGLWWIPNFWHHLENPDKYLNP